MHNFYRTFVCFFISLSFITACESQIDKQSDHSLTSPQCINGQERCQVETAQGLLQVLFNTKKVQPETEFIITAVPSFDSSNVELTGYIEGKSMYMGRIPVFFTKNSEGVFEASAMLASCSENTMAWRLQLMIVKEGEEQDRLVSFEFESQSN